MKKIVIFPLLLFYSYINSQSLLQTSDGVEIVNNNMNVTNDVLLGNVNTSDESLQLKAILALKNTTGVLPSKYFTFTVKGKPSNGVSKLFSGGDFNVNSSYKIGFSKLNLFSGNSMNSNSSFFDFYSIEYEFALKKHILFKSGNTYEQQIDKFTFKGHSVTLNYNILFKGKHLLTSIIGFNNKSNYDDLEDIEIKNFTLLNSPNSTEQREVSSKVNAKFGDYREYNTIPLRFAYTYITSEEEENKDKLKIGFTVYYANNIGKEKPISNLGGIIFLTKQDKISGIRNPVLGIVVQSNDLFNVKDSQNNFGKRLSIGLTSTFNLLNF